ncbi:uncharacterized protein [Chironomus tepperi]|uniref:uncharacterized protein n=1 Tax=Chironomus tepperi TaxID=113505 RepID=UPI00391F4649
MEITVPFSSYKLMRFFAIFGGLIGVFQSLVWLGLSITAILGYYCNIDFAGTGANYGTILQLTLYHMYFQGEDCTPNQFPGIEFEAIQGLDLMTPSTVNIWMWVILSFSAVWLFSSLTLIINVKKSNLKYANVFLYIWVLITFVISMIDLVVFIFFVLDYETLLSHSFSQSLNFAPPTTSVLLSAQVSAGIMFSVALRGYFLWAVNLGICLFLFTQTFKIYDFNKLAASGVANNGFLNNAYRNEDGPQAAINNVPIKGYETQVSHPWYNYLTTDIPRARPPTMMRSSSLEDNFQKRMNTVDPKNTTPTEVVLRSNNTMPNRHSNANNLGYVQTPAPAFEAKPQLRSGILRNSRYQ